MERHLRLAEARGSLKAPNSPVQDRGLEYLVYLRQRREADSLIDSIRLAALPTGGFARETLEQVFPDIFPPDPFAKALQEDGTYDIDQIDGESVEWSVPTTAEDDDDISRWIEQRDQQSATAADLSDPDNEGWR